MKPELGMGTGCSSRMDPVSPCLMFQRLQKHFGHPTGQRSGCGFPVAHLLALFHVGTGMLSEVVSAPLCTHDMSGIAQLHPKLSKGDLLLGDRGLCSFTHLALLARSDTRYFASISVRSSTSHRIGPTPSRGKSATRRGVLAHGGCDVCAQLTKLSPGSGPHNDQNG